MNNLFRLISTYELFFPPGSTERLVRIDVLQSVSDNKMYRARVWRQTTYNLYPTFLNTGNKGEDLRHTHSSDQLDTDITILIAESPDLLTGVRCESEQDFIKYLISRVMQCKELSGQ
jgi:hypothetical protein